MKYGKMLKKLFPQITLKVEDLFFLESFQIRYLPERVLKEEFAVLLREHPIIHRYFNDMCPAVSKSLNSILKENVSSTNDKTVSENCQDLLWEIGDLIVYSKYPEIYDANVEFVWEIDEIISPQLLKGKVAVDAGSGPGKLAFKAARVARTVFAVEPVKGFREFMKKKAKTTGTKNLYTLDGCLDSIPLPDNFADVLMTSQTIGWNLQGELLEIERILKPGGRAIHLFKNPEKDSQAARRIHDFLTSPEWGYKYFKIDGPEGVKIKYQKIY